LELRGPDSPDLVTRVDDLVDSQLRTTPADD
jgi:hypothetical protein